MNKQEELYFAALSKDRAESADTLEKPSICGTKNSVVEKYSDQAHFIYELLQNADDAKATTARFVLESNRLIFAHNGTRHFSISDPAKEKEDSLTGKLGDINAITSIGNSNKTEESIGKFGVGFKAVFRYTATPQIYDPEFHFRIDRFIVPTLIHNDFEGRKKGETLFVFPFNHPERNADEAYRDISEKLSNLSFPLLFLTELKEIKFKFNSTVGIYGKNIVRTLKYENTIAEHICLIQDIDSKIHEKRLWLFSRIDDYQHRYSVGFFMDEEGHLIPVNEPAFCFFPTREVTGLNFILHAPFLLTDSREGIRAGIEYNDKMIQNLAILAADSIMYLRDISMDKPVRLIDDNILKIIPVERYNFSVPLGKQKVSFMPFYDKIKEKFEKSELLPSAEGYVSPENAYWASVPQITQLFSNVQLAEITGNEKAQWVFTSLGHDETQRNKTALFYYIDSLVYTSVGEDAIIGGRFKEFSYNYGYKQPLKKIKGITPDFIELQSFDWLHKFYKWLSETKKRKEQAITKPVFLNQNGKAVAAFDNKNQNILFFPVENIEGYSVVHPKLLENQETKQFLIDIGIKEPSLKDQIYNKILPQYEQSSIVDDADSHFMIFFKYYCKCENEEVEEFIDLIKECEFLAYYDKDDSTLHHGSANSMYLPTKELEVYFATKKDIRFLALDEYQDRIDAKDEKKLMSFFAKLGIKKEISIITNDIDFNLSGRDDLPHPYSTRGITYEENIIEGCKEIIKHICDEKDVSKSVVLWNALLKIIELHCGKWKSLGNILCGTVKYFYRSSKSDTFASSDAKLLKKSAWIKNRSGEFVSPSNICFDALSDVYNTTSEYATELLNFLGIKMELPPKNDEDDSNLTNSQREKIALANKLKEYGIESEADLVEYQEYRRQKIAAQKSTEQLLNNVSNGLQYHCESNLDNTSDEPDCLFSDSPKSDDEDSPKTQVKQRVRTATTEIIKDIAHRTKGKHSSTMPVISEEIIDIDEDEFMPSTVDYSKKIELAKEKSAAEIDRIEYFGELQNRAIQLTQDSKYTVAWFNTLLEMESINSGEANASSKEISISFAHVEREPDTKRTLVLKHPNRYIPQFMEELADIPLILHMGDQKKTVAIEVVNIKSYTLRVKLKNGSDIDGIDLASVTAATIDAKSPTFLLEELRKQFSALDLPDDFNMKDNLCKNIEFIFGPPGTGKTTHLAQNVLIPMMKNNSECKVLVLAPTNKAADVLAKRVIEISGKDTSYTDWLIRFGGTNDEEIEENPIFKDKTFDIRNSTKNVTITTIARFPYDFFMPHGIRVFLCGINWDYIVIDEASMIPIANIVFPLYKKTPHKFIIAGDPFQIEPITSVDLWKNENIYTMVKLDSFLNPKTEPHQYKVELLTTQYRSIPSIGDIFSHFTYGGILKHYRSADSQRQLNVGNDLGIETLNIIKYPVSKYESIYRAKRLQHSSSYQVHSALFTFEYICYLSKAISENNPGSLFRIGVIAPYRAQADMIDKLLASEKLPSEVNVQVGTIHGFQGDECDIIFAVFNTPPTISTSKEMFLNKYNIINVSISRARDYLFIIMPDDNTEGISNLFLVKQVERLIHKTEEWNEFLTGDIEDLMFDNPKYLEENTFSTSHQSVNVYGLPERCYEIRTEDNAVDVQIHRGISDAIKKSESNQISEEVCSSVEEQQSNSHEESVEPSVSCLPKELRRNIIPVQVFGAHKGKFFLVPYKGKLKYYTKKSVSAMFIPQIRFGKEKLIPVSVIEEEHIIYITKENYKMFEKGLTTSEYLELRNMFLDDKN